MSDYYEKALVKANPLITELLDKYRVFKLRKIIRDEIAVGSNGIVNLSDLELIRQTNLKNLAYEKHATILCGSKDFIKTFIIDFNGVGPIGAAYG